MRCSLRWLLASALLAALSLGLGVMIPRPLWPELPASTAVETQHILVLSNPIHTDIAIPATPEVLTRFNFLNQAGVPLANPAVGYVIFGWGGRSFYLETPRWADLKPMPVFRALTVDSSVMHVDVATDRLVESPSATGFDINPAGFERLLAFIDGSFARAGEQIQPIAGAHYGDNDAFFEANGSFNALTGCNTWTAAALRKAGLRTGLWNPLPKSLIWSLRLFNG